MRARGRQGGRPETLNGGRRRMAQALRDDSRPKRRLDLQSTGHHAPKAPGITRATFYRCTAGEPAQSEAAQAIIPEQTHAQ